jgi:hypothetical protein
MLAIDERGDPTGVDMRGRCPGSDESSVVTGRAIERLDQPSLSSGSKTPEFEWHRVSSTPDSSLATHSRAGRNHATIASNTFLIFSIPAQKTFVDDSGGVDGADDVDDVDDVDGVAGAEGTDAEAEVTPG